ncbi:hypothetical protein Aab01nite_57830 [Paractinoplanes abujensis]|uniref:Putative enzyme related to lactoylglutathione lyase n=1 Tax=Paractinoplanes abujensis TaxID=882441 RepID=A0A7W7G4S0_9ACTN|nr:VOC family protein [Actinoplanes abujensis]MBB4696202.1 putative enzyme related to lactoylglutathione lyase [Actinoplanes abujensis]GID22193.1 hypothetical protein Aab01nite_57830 [Actinoplanes abujensis]
MATRLVQINMKAHDDAALGRFWSQVLGWGIDHEAPGVTNLEPPGLPYPDPHALFIDIVTAPEPKTVKNRVHIDLATTSLEHQAALVARLQELGAKPADVGQKNVPWVVLADPDGNEFCVLEPRTVYQDTGPIAAIVVDCADPRAMAGWWAQAIDWQVHTVTDEGASMRSSQGVGPYLEFVRTPTPKTVWNRVHLDLRPYQDDNFEAEISRLQSLGATPIDLGDPEIPWRVLADPEGNEFCLLTPR